MNRIVLFLLFVIFIILLSGCLLQEPSIGDIASHPQSYDGKSVVLSGRVIGIRTNVMGGEITVVRNNEYTLTDASGGIKVRTNSTPKYWDPVKISGVVHYSMGSCPPGMPPPPGFSTPKSICSYISIDEISRTPIHCEELPQFPITYSQDQYHFQLCPINLTNCNITRGMDCSMKIQCNDGRSLTRSAQGVMEVDYPPIRSKNRYIMIGNNGAMSYGDFTLVESQCLKNMVMFY